ncbi:DRTGG domain-containing protein [Marispirochaeta aestuarii]|uniref:DRTGG domain-containing protein n=1 Tax=Marispirochaeta aestuarii TaxID=1963862 RepID=UPI0029C679CF|nr:DRTGG domain-containing protein [Marispirochaeta aestuarii]
MRFPDISSCLECEEYHRGDNYESAEVKNVTAGDLMSEVLVFDKENLLLITSLNSEQTMRTAHVVDALGVILVNGKRPSDAMIRLASELGISLLSTKKTLFDTCVALHYLITKAECGA